MRYRLLVVASWHEEMLAARIGEGGATSYYTFCEDQEAASYGVAYIVTADGLSGTTSDWMMACSHGSESVVLYCIFRDKDPGVSASFPILRQKKDDLFGNTSKKHYLRRLFHYYNRFLCLQQTDFSLLCSDS